jgi:putative membrane protein
LHAFLAFLSYFATAVALLAAFVFLYVRFTPYNEFALIAQNNQAAAITLAGAALGFTFPLLSSIYFTQGLLEMAKWATVTCVIQLLVFTVMRRQARHIEAGHTAAAILLASLSVCVGLINALCISH